MKYEKVAQEWLEKKQIEFDNFLFSVKNEDYREYDLSSSRIENYDELSNICKECIFSQIKKYREYEGGRLENRFEVDCKGIPNHYIRPEILEKFGVEEGSERYWQLLSTRDPVAWARCNGYDDKGRKVIPRDIQVPMLQCSSTRAIFRCGRRTGKSLAVILRVLYECIVLPEQPYIQDEDGKKRRSPITALIITPRQSHSDNLWRKFEDQLNNSEVVRDSVLTYKKNPYCQIEFKNGSNIFMITAGTGSANAGLSIRSFSADFLILDEGNYLGEEELKASGAILATNTQCKLIVSSTPMGIQDFFYEWCFRSPGYKDFHFPTILLPHWDSIKKSIYQDCQTVDDFLHEYMAVFSPPGHNVFRMDLIDKAKINYSYEDLKPNPDWIYSIGIDWNTNVGSEIVVIGFDREQSKYIVVETINVPRSEWTQLRSCEVLMETTVKYDPDIVLADEGHGGTQIELLRKTALQSSHPIIQKMIHTLRPYQFGSKVEIIDPITRQPVKKAAKPLLVRSAVQRFEEEDIWISSNDKLLLDQLSLYQVKSISIHGNPVYWVPRDDIGDHRLDAFMLALLGFKLKHNNMFGKGSVVTDTAFLPLDKSSFEEKKGSSPESEKITEKSKFLSSGKIQTRSSQAKIGRSNVKDLQGRLDRLSRR